MQSEIVKNCFLREYVIRDLPVGEKCYVRVSAGNIRGFGPPAVANPPYCVPSSESKHLAELNEERFLSLSLRRLARILQDFATDELRASLRRDSQPHPTGEDSQRTSDHRGQRFVVFVHLSLSRADVLCRVS